MDSAEHRRLVPSPGRDYTARRGPELSRMAKRVLFIGNFDGHRRQGRYYNTDHKLRNGFIRAGHQVVAIDERATVRWLSPVGIKPIGQRRLRRDAVETARHHRPHLVVLGNTDLLGEPGYAALREALPHARFASYFTDAFTHPNRNLERLARRATYMDAVFATTADARVMAAVAPRRNVFWYLPNPVDEAVEVGRADARPRDELGFDGIFLGTDVDGRRAQLDTLRAALPADYRFDVGGRRFADERMTGPDFLERLADAAVCPQLPRDDSAPEVMPYLYTSARIAQTMGQGVLALTPAAARFEDLYEDGIVSYGSRAELAAQMLALRDDDARRRRIAGRGREIAHSRTNGTRVARYIVDVVLTHSLSESYEWPTTPLV